MREFQHAWPLTKLHSLNHRLLMFMRVNWAWFSVQRSWLRLIKRQFEAASRPVKFGAPLIHLIIGQLLLFYSRARPIWTSNGTTVNEVIFRNNLSAQKLSGQRLWRWLSVSLFADSACGVRPIWPSCCFHCSSWIDIASINWPCMWAQFEVVNRVWDLRIFISVTASSPIWTHVYILPALIKAVVGW